MRRIHLTSFRPSHLALLVLPGLVTACPSDDTSATASATDSDTEDESTSNDDDDPTDDPDTSTTEDPSMPTTSSPSTTVDPDSSSSSETSESDSDPSTSTGGPVCGDGVVDQGEDCDSDDLDGEDCASQGFLGGELACASDCTFDIDACTQATCGDDIIEGTEECEGDDLNGSDCVMEGFDAGELACDACAFDTDACIMFSCGDNMQQDKELCDGADLAGEDCVSQGFPGGGTLLCDANCGGFDDSQCLDVACGNGVVEPGEVCDGADVGGATCGDLGFTDGSITCADDCQSTSATGCFTQTSFCATPGSSIGPDANVITLSNLDVAGLVGNVIDVNVSVDLTHTFLGDLDTFVSHTNTNTQTFLIQDTCSLADDMNATFDQDLGVVPDCVEPIGIEGVVLPVGSLDVFNGVAGSGNGTWQLNITDDAFGDAGVLAEWCVIISTDAPADQGCSAAFEQDAYDASTTFIEATELADTRMAIAWDGTNLWSASGGGPQGNRTASHDAAGVVLQYFQPNLDLRSVFTLGDGTGPLYSRAYNDPQIRVQQAPGVFVNDVVLAGGVLDAQSAVVWDEGTSEFIAHIGGTVGTWDAAGNSTGSVALAGFGVGNENQYPQNRGVASACGYYLTYSESTLSAWDAAGARVDTTVLNGAGASFDSHFSYSYAQGTFFVLDDVGGSWRAYDVL